MNIIKIIKMMISVFLILAGVNTYFSFLASQANDERSQAYEKRRDFSLASHEFRTTSLELTRLVRAYIVMGKEPSLELYWMYLRDVDRLGAIRQLFIDIGAVPYEIELLDKALAYQQKLRDMDALAIEARTVGDYQLALDISYSLYYTAYGEAFVGLLNQLIDATQTRTQGMVDSSEAAAFFFQNLALAATVLLGLVGVFGMIFILHRVKDAMQREREANELNQIYLDASPLFVELWNDEMNVIDCNEKTAEIFGLSEKHEFVTKYRELSPEYQPCGTKSTEMSAALMEKVIKEGSVRFEWMHIKPDGEELPVDTTLVRIKSGGKNVIVGYNMDLRPIKASMQREREAHALTQAILDSAPFVISLWDDNFNIVTLNQQSVEMFGLSDPKEITGYMPYTISPAYQPCGTPTMEKARQCIGKAYSEGYSRFEWMHQTATGEPLPVEIIAKRFNHDGKDMLVSYTIDMRDMKAAMEKERDALELTQTILESAPFVIVLWDDNYNVVAVSQQSKEVLKVSDTQEIMGNKIFDFCPARQPCGTPTVEKARQCLGKAYSEGYSQFELMFQTAIGEPLPVEVFTKRFNRNGKDMLVSYTIDMREMKAAMEKEREANELNEILLSSAPFVMNIWDDSYNLVSTSKQAVEMFGSPSQEQFMEHFFEFAPELQPCGAISKEKSLENIKQVFRDGKRIQFEWMHKNINGEPLPTEKTLVRFMRQGKYMVAAYTTDLRPVKAAEALTRKLLDNSPLFMEFWDENNNLLDCNKRMIEVFGTGSKDEFINHFYDFTAPHQPCGASPEEKNMAMVKLAMEKGCSRSEWMFILPNGEELPTETTWVRIMHQSKPMIIVYSQDLRPIKQETQEKLAEIRRRELAEEESLAKTRFLARMSHEIRTPMNAVLGITEIQLQKDCHPAETEEAFLRIQSSSNLLLTIINDILDLSKVEAGKMEILPEAYDFASMIVDTVQLNIMRVGSKNIDFKLNVDERLPSHMIGDELRIKQILNNILSNAFKYTNEGFVALSVSMEDTCPTPGCITLVLRVQDTGQGMTRDQISNLFAIEFNRFNLRSNRFIEGSGLGMIIAYQLITMMEGDIKVESELDSGSVFTVRIPQEPSGSSTLGREAVENLQNFEVSQKSLRKMAKLVSLPMPYGRVLVVDDVESNLYVAKGLLMPYKIAVETVTDGYNAIEKVKAGAVYDIIFMDHMMPGMDGIEATKIIRDMGYEHPIVALTANALKDVSEMFIINGFNGFLPKPINLIQFNACLVRYIRNKQPPEVIEAAEKQYAGAESTGNLLDSLRESFLLDARRALDILEPLIETLSRRQELDIEGLKSFVIQAHAMKSALYNIGRADSSKAAFVLETAGRTADMETLRAFAPRFLNSLKELIRELSPEDTGHDTEDEDVDFLKAQFILVAQACKQFDLEAANNALEKLSEKQCSKRTKELIKDISANLLYGGFDEAIALANKAAGIVV